MIICPICREEIDDDSRFCDQCGHALLYCSSCGRVGVGRRCTSCGSMMLSADEKFGKAGGQAQGSVFASSSMVDMSSHIFKSVTASKRQPESPSVTSSMLGRTSTLHLVNESLNIHIAAVNGAVIGRRQGPYSQFFEKNMYVSGVHAQLMYNNESGWCVIDKHSSNGTKLNQRPIQPDVQMVLRNDDVLTIANVNLQVKIN